MCHQIGGHRPTVDRIDDRPVFCSQMFSVVAKLPCVTDAAVVAGLPEVPGEFLKFGEGSGVQKIDDRNSGMGDSVFVSGVDVHESRHPGVEELSLGQSVFLPDVHMSGIVFHEPVPDDVLVHGTGAVGVDFTKFVASRVLVVEDVKAGDGQGLVVARVRQNQFLQLAAEGEQATVAGVGKVAVDDLAADAVHGGDDIGEDFFILLSVDLLHRQRTRQQVTVAVQRRTRKFFPDRQAGCFYFIVMRGDISLAVLVDFFSGIFHIHIISIAEI